MKSIVFSLHPENIRIEARSATCVYHKSYSDKLPIMANCEYVEFAALCKEFQTRDFFTGKEVAVFVGANKFFNPSTRFHPVFDLLQYNLPQGIKRYSIDVSPYIGPIWRLWTHFSFAGVPFGEYTYSYLLESHYNAHLDGKRDDNPMDLDKIRRYAAGHVQIDYERYFAEPEIRIVSMPPEIHDEYRTLKARLFDEHDTIGPILRGLTAFARSACPARKVPQEHKIFEAPEAVGIIRTDLKIDEYLTDQLVGKMNEVNRTVEVLRQ